MSSNVNLNFVVNLQEEPTDSVHLINTNYVRKSLLRYHNGKVYGNWSPNRNQVCQFSDTRYYIEENDIVSIETAGICEQHNDEILMFTHH
uniref:hypothetical protein n=1 Tax=Flavobacterium sp. TaxID=239 RepID=UPI00404A2702